MLAIALPLSAATAGTALAAPPAVENSELLALGFKPLVASTPVESGAGPAGACQAMQRNGKKFYIYGPGP
jgi:hypothetical protein